MERLIKAKRDAFDSACYAIKAIALFCCFYPLFEKFFDYSPKETMMTISMNSVVTMLLMLVVVLAVWLVLQTNHSTKAWRKWLEIIVFNGICFASVLVSGASASNYKFLFLLSIVTYTIQYGVRYGFIVAGSSSAILLLMDLITIGVRKQAIISFQSDVALAFTFAVTAFILGRYVSLEEEHINELIHMANYDSLTNLFNHRYFHDKMNETWTMTKKDGTGLAVVMMDIDYFKLYNDIRGHQAGDYALTCVADLIRKSVRPQDVACRYGGQEFAVIMPNATLQQAGMIAEQIRRAIMDAPIEGEEYMPGGHLTISLGVSVVREEDENYNDVVSRADSALYRAKYLRKNRVETYQDIFDEMTNLDPQTKAALLPIRGLSGIINMRDDYTYSHTERVAMCCGIVAKYAGLSEEERQTLLLGAYMHDVGKINISKEILIAGRRLTNEEWEIMKRHPLDGQTAIEQIAGMQLVGRIVGEHHERYDGSGYPRGLKGDEIHPLSAILAIADSFDAMTNDRPYQKKRSVTAALQEIKQKSGTMYDPRFAPIFIEAVQNELLKGNSSILQTA